MSGPFIVTPAVVVRRTSAIGKLRPEFLMSSYLSAKQAAVDNLKKEHDSASHIQRVFRGFRARKKFWTKKRAAIAIQRVWRGYRFGRKLAREIRERRRLEQRRAFLNLQATKVQALFRGYMSRKKKFDYAARKRTLAEIGKRGELTRQYVVESVVEQREREKKEKEEAQTALFHRVAPKLHYLVSTSHIRGVLCDRRLQLASMESKGVTASPSSSKRATASSSSTPSPSRVLRAQEIGLPTRSQQLRPARAPLRRRSAARAGRTTTGGGGRTRFPRRKSEHSPTSHLGISSLAGMQSIEQQLRETTRRKVLEADKKLSETLRSKLHMTREMQRWGSGRKRTTTMGKFSGLPEADSGEFLSHRDGRSVAFGRSVYLPRNRKRVDRLRRSQSHDREEDAILKRRSTIELDPGRRVSGFSPLSPGGGGDELPESSLQTPFSLSPGSPTAEADQYLMFPQLQS